MGYNTNWMFDGIKKCPTCDEFIDNPRENQVYCNQKCYSKSSKLKEQAKSSKLMELSKGNNWRLGKKHSDKSKEQISKNTPKKTGDSNPKWKGDNVGYDALHDWVHRHKDFSGECEICGLKSDNRRIIQAANISG